MESVFEKQTGPGNTHTRNWMSNPLIQGQPFHQHLKRKHKQKTPLQPESLDQHAGPLLPPLCVPSCLFSGSLRSSTVSPLQGQCLLSCVAVPQPCLSGLKSPSVAELEPPVSRPGPLKHFPKRRTQHHPEPPIGPRGPSHC